jgi:hypothetical protein
VPGFQAYYVIYAPDDTVTAVSIFENYAAAQESNKRALAWIETAVRPVRSANSSLMFGSGAAHQAKFLTLSMSVGAHLLNER